MNDNERRKILIVEDEDSLRQIMSSVLRAHGYHVIETAGVTHALAILRDQNGPPDLVVTDINLEDGDGFTLAERAVAAHPSIKIVFASGDRYGVRERYGDGPRAPRVLLKPFTLEELVSAVRAAIRTSMSGGDDSCPSES